MAKVAVTGAAGFLGSHVSAALAHEVVHLPREARRSPAAARVWIEGERPAAVVHLAGIVDVRYCAEHPAEAFDAHVTQTASLLEALRLAAPETPFLYVATDKSFGEQEDCGLDAPYLPGFPYETSKACEDLLVSSYATTYALPAYLLRFPNFFGEGDRHAERLIPGICTALARGEPFTVRTRLDGTVRQYVYVRDAAQILARTLEAALAGEEVWPRSHFGPPFLKTVGDVIRDLEAVTGRTLDLEVLDLPGEVSRLSLRDENGLGFAYTEWLPALERTASSYGAVRT